MANPKSEATYEQQQQNIKAQSGLKQQELGLGETQLQQQNQFTEKFQGQEYALADKYAKQNLGLSLADIYAQIAQQKHELPITLNQIESQAGAQGAFLSKGRIQGQQEATYNEQQAVGSLGRSATRANLSYSQQIATEKLAMDKLKAGDILGYNQLKAQDKLKSQGLNLEEQKSLMDLQNAYAKTLTVSDIQNALYNHAMSADDATKRLIGMGYDPADAALIVQGYTRKSPVGAKGKQLTVSDIQKAFVSGQYNQAEALQALEDQGWNPDSAALLLQEAQQGAGGGVVGGVPKPLTGMYYIKGKDSTGKAYDVGVSIGRGQQISDTRAGQMRGHPFYSELLGAVQNYLQEAGTKPSLKDLVTYVQSHTTPPSGTSPDTAASYLSLALSDYFASGGGTGEPGGQTTTGINS